MRIKPCIWLGFLVLLIFQSAFATEFRIGLRAHSGLEKGISQWKPTADHLTKMIPEHSFIIIPYVSLAELNTAAANGEFDFVLTNPSSYVEMEVLHGASRILTLRNKRQGKGYTQFGSVIFTRSDRSDINTLQDLNDKVFIAVSDRAFGGWRVTHGELLKQGIHPQKDFSNLIYAQGVQENVVTAVKEGIADAGTVRTDMLERMAAEGSISLSDFKILNEKKTPDFPFLHSTDLYPEWVFANFKNTPDDIVHRVATVLLLISPTSEAAISGKYEGWTAPLNYQPVHDLLRTLQVEPYENYGKISMEDVLAKYWPWISLFSLLFIGIILFSAVITRSNRSISFAHSELKKSNQNLTERVKELNCIYSLSNILADEQRSLDDKLQQIVELMPPSWQYPELACARVVYGENEFLSSGYVASQVFLFGEIRVKNKIRGSVYVHYSDDIVDIKGDKPFLKEEHSLIAEVCYRLSSYILKTEMERELLEAHSDLEKKVIERTRELENAKLIAEKASLAKSEFLSRMSHELRTPMNAILGFSQILAMEMPEGEQKDNISEIVLAGDHLLELINEVLDLARIESGKFDINLKNVNIHDLLKESIQMMYIIAEKNEVTLDAPPDHTTVQHIKADYMRLKQVLINLLSNAIKYNTKGGKVTIRYSEGDNGYTRINIIDTGKGLSESDRAIIFEPFERLNEEYKTEGTGIGLAVSRNLVQLMGGRIGVDSTLGQGSTFWIELKKVV